MLEPKCPVMITINKLDKTISSGSLKDPKSRRIAEEILSLMRDIAWGSASSEHIPAIESLAQELIDEGSADACIDTGKLVSSVLSEHPESFLNHVESHNCPTGDCVYLVPAPCQMACPAGIDIPTYVTLIGQGKDAEAIEVIREDNPFPWVCGLVCTRPCEFMCVRGHIDTPVSIKFLKTTSSRNLASFR